MDEEILVDSITSNGVSHSLSSKEEILIQPLIIGKQTEGELTYIPRETLTESVIGQTYEAHVRTQSLLGLGGASKENIANIIIRELPKRVPGLKLNWIEVGDTMIKLQFIGSPFAWSLFLAALPSILQLVGITVSLIGVYLVWSKIPSWTLGVLLLGLALLYLAPKLGALDVESLKGLVK